MIDFHSHIIPGVDDGAKNFCEAKEMLEIAVKNGIESIICTPHSSGIECYGVETVKIRFRELKRIIESNEMPINIYLASEVRCEIDLMDSVMERLDRGILPTINDTQFALVEFYCSNTYEVVICIERLLENGITPVVAHAERYLYWTVDLIRNMKASGIKIQINFNSLFGDDLIRERVLELLEYQMADYVGTDAHNLRDRSPKVLMAINFLLKNYNNDYIDGILYKNAKKIIES